MGFILIIVVRKVDLLPPSISLPNSFACFNFLSIARLIFCKVDQSQILVFIVFYICYFEDDCFNLHMILIDLLKLFHSLFVLVSVPPLKVLKFL